MSRPHASSSAASNRHRGALRSLVAPSLIIACQIRAIGQSFSLVEFHESGHRSTPMYVIVRCCHDVAGLGKTASGLRPSTHESMDWDIRHDPKNPNGSLATSTRVSHYFASVSKNALAAPLATVNVPFAALIAVVQWTPSRFAATTACFFESGPRPNRRRTSAIFEARLSACSKAVIATPYRASSDVLAELKDSRTPLAK